MIIVISVSSRRRHTRLQGDWSSDVCSFVSSRRRHTRLQGDWSSDVCSSDLQVVAGHLLGFGVARAAALGRNAPDLPLAGAVGVEVDPLAIRRILGTVVVGALGSEALLVAARRGDAE